MGSEAKPRPQTHFYTVWTLKNVSHDNILSSLQAMEMAVTKFFPLLCGRRPISRMGRMLQHSQHPP